MSLSSHLLSVIVHDLLSNVNHGWLIWIIIVVNCCGSSGNIRKIRADIDFPSKRAVQQMS